MARQAAIAADSPGRPQASRLLPLDALRGLIMVLMALDHASHFVAQKHPASEMWGGPFPAYSDPLAFITRFVTHFSAPGFFFLMGAGMFLFAEARRKHGWGEWAITRFFLIRGGLLIALKFLVINRAWELSPGGWGVGIYIGVLFALGAGMILCSLFLRLRTEHLLMLAAALLVGTELLVPAPGQWGPMKLAGPLGLLNPLLLTPGGMPEVGLWSNYPLLPWLELMVFGMAFGHWLAAGERQAYRRSLLLGAAFLALFLVLRVADGFGNIRPRMGDTWMDFLNVVKYPPSMAFTFMTMGVNLILLNRLAGVGGKLLPVTATLAVFGRVPLFFYVLHLFLYAGLGRLFTPRGTSIPGMLPFWFLGLLVLYPLCLWYGRLKQQSPAASILRFL